MVATESNVAQDEAASLYRGLPFAITTEQVLFVLFVGGLAWAPFWFGSNRLIAWGVNAILFAGLAGLYELSLIVRRKPHAFELRRVRLPAILFAVVVIWILAQITSLTPAGWHHPIWQLASEVLGEHLDGRVTVDPDLTALALLRLMTAASVLWLALQLCSDSARAQWLVWSTIGICAVYATAGLYAVAFMPNGRLFPLLGPTKLVTSTFVNHNHYVTYAGIGLIATVATVLRLYRRSLSQSGYLWHLKIAALINTTGNKAALPLALGCVILVALMLTGSRGGIGAMLVGLFALFVLNIGKSTGRSEVLVLLFATILAAVGLYAFSDVLMGSFVERGLTDQGRPAVLKLTIGSIGSAPLLGFGYGTFSSAFPMFRDDTLNLTGFWDKAHNTYIEIFQGLGLVFGAMLIASVVILVWHCFNGARTRKRGATIPAIAASVSVMVGAHAVLDFSLQIQAVTLTYMSILGAGVAQAYDPPRNGRGLAVENASMLRDPHR